MNRSDILNESKKEIRSILISYQKGCFLSEFVKSYREMIGRSLPSRELGFRSDIDFLYSIPDVVVITHYRNGDYHLQGIADEKSKHIQEMVCKQKPAKLKVPTRVRSFKYHVPPRFIETLPTSAKPTEIRSTFSSASAVTKLTEPKSTFSSASAVTKLTPKEKIASLVKCFKNGILLNDLLTEYEEKYKKSFSFAKYGFTSLGECIKSISELDLAEENNELIVFHTSNMIRDSSKDMPEKDFQNNGVSSSKDALESKRHSISSKGNIPESMKQKLHKVAEKMPRGILASDFPNYFEEVLQIPFELHSFGYNCLADFIDDASDIFIREPAPGSQREMIYPVDKYEHDSNGNSFNSQSGISVVDNIIFNIRTILEANSEGIKLQEFFHVYSINCRVSLCLKDLGFRDLETFLLIIKDRVPLKIVSIDGVKFIHLVKSSDYSDDNVPEATDNVPEVIPYDVEFPDYEFSQQSLTVNLNEYIPVYVSTVAHPSHLYIQLDEDSTEKPYKKLAHNLQNFYNGPHSKHYLMKDVHIKIGAACVALWPSDHHWYRCQIIGIPSMTNVQLHYVDYGTRDVVPKSMLRYLKKEFSSLPAQAFRCCLAYVKPSKNSPKWDPRVKPWLLNMTTEILLMAKIVEIKPDGVYSIVLCDTNGENDVYLNDLLRSEGFADYAIADSNKNIPSSPEMRPHEHHNLSPLQALQAQCFLQAFATAAPSFAQNENYLTLLKQVSMYCPNSDPTRPQYNNPLNLDLPNINMFQPGLNLYANPYLMQNNFASAATSFGTGSSAVPCAIPPPKSCQDQLLSSFCSDSFANSKSSAVQTSDNKICESEVFDDDDDDMFQQFCQKICSTKVRHVKRVFLGDGYKIHVIVVDSKPYASSGDISQLIWNNKEAEYLSRRLQIKDVDFPTITLSEDGSEECFQQLERLNVKGVQKTTGFKNSILLYPLEVVIKILNLFGHPSISLRTKLTEEIAKFNPEDPVWKEFSTAECTEPEEEENLLGVTDDDKIERLCLYDLLAMKEGIKCKRLKMMNSLNNSNSSKSVDELRKLEQMQEKVLQRIQEIREICNLFA